MGKKAEITPSRKTIRFEEDTLKTVTEAGYSNDNAAINGLLRELVKLRKKRAEDEIFHGVQQQKITDANNTARDWKEKYDAKCAELQQLQSALALVGKFMRPPEL